MNQQEIIEAAAKFEDQTKVTKIENQIAPVGKTVCRLIEYVELGIQPRNPFQGKAKAPCDQVRIVFELLGPKNLREVEIDGTKKMFADRVYLTLPKLMNDKAKFFKLFNKLRYGRTDKTHMAQMIGEPFVVTMYHNPSKSDPTKIYANPNTPDGDFTFESPRLENPVTGQIEVIPVPPALSPTKVFVWNFPDKESWGSLFIEGTYKKNNQDVSKNFIQETILKALNFKDSPLEHLLAGDSELNSATQDIQGDALAGVV